MINAHAPHAPHQPHPPHKTPLKRLNMMNGHGFVRTIGHVFENSPWVAERAFHNHPFTTLDDLHAKMCGAVKSATDDEKLALIRAHPDLVGKMVRQLSPESKAEQAAAGLDRLSPDD